MLDGQQGREAAVRLCREGHDVAGAGCIASEAVLRRYLAGLGYWFLQSKCTEGKLKDKTKDHDFLNGCCVADGEFEPDKFWLEKPDPAKLR